MCVRELTLRNKDHNFRMQIIVSVNVNVDPGRKRARERKVTDAKSWCQGQKIRLHDGYRCISLTQYGNIKFPGPTEKYEKE